MLNDITPVFFLFYKPYTTRNCLGNKLFHILTTAFEVEIDSLMKEIHFSTASAENAATVLPGTCLERRRMFWRR